MNKQSGRIGLYLVLIVALIAGYLYLNNQVAVQSDYTYGQLEQAVTDGNATVQDDGNGNRIYALAYTVEEDLTSLPAGMSAETQVPLTLR
mgnify:CR=1 FL=1